MTLLRRRWRIAILLAILGIAAASFAIAETLRYAAAPTSIDIAARPIANFDNRDPSRTRFGALEFRGGLVLTSKHTAFGGISGLIMESDGEHFIGVTDNGSWLRGRITYKDGRPAGVTDAEMAPLLGADGKSLAARGWFDAESLGHLGGKLYVGFERVEQIVRFDYRRDGFAARGEPIPVPPDFKSFVFNKSLECVAGGPDNGPLAGNLIVITEASLDSAGNHRAFLLKNGEVARFSLKRIGPFEVTDCAVLPPNDLLVLERDYAPTRGVSMRIRRIPLSSIQPGAVVDGRVLVDADLGYQIDNMEGIGIHRAPNGDTILTLVSDDNFSVIQRTLLLQFAIVAD